MTRRQPPLSARMSQPSRLASAKPQNLAALPASKPDA